MLSIFKFEHFIKVCTFLKKINIFWILQKKETEKSEKKNKKQRNAKNAKAYGLTGSAHTAHGDILCGASAELVDT
jgi:hypothetical protein